MDDKTSSSSAQTQKSADQLTIPSTEVAGTEHRQAYGTAKTENLRDSGLWRFLTPAVVIIFCLMLLAVPLLILIPLLANSLTALGTANTQEASLLWVWITMIVISVAIAAIIIRGLCKIFLTQAINYEKR